MKKAPLIIGICFLLACNFFNQEKKSQNNFDNFLEDYFQESLKLYRINATFLGDDRYNDSLPDFLSPEFLVKQKHFFACQLCKRMHWRKKNIF